MTSGAAVLDLEPVQRLTRDLKVAAIVLSPAEARYLVDSYYTLQDYRKAAGNQRLALGKVGEPHSVIDWLFDQMETLENQIKRALDAWTDGQIVGQWAKSIVGIGPVITAGLLAHIDITKAPTAGHIWRFAGIDSEVEWLGKERARELVNSVVPEGAVTSEHLATIAQLTHRKLESIEKVATDRASGNITRASLTKGLSRPPWNAGLKTLCWKVGESFVKFSNHQQDVYGKVYQQRKAQEIERNEAGVFAEQAARVLREKRIGKGTEAYTWYSQGKLPPAHIHARAKRFAVKLFLAHYQAVAYEVHYGTKPPKPFVIEHMGHVGYIQAPNWPMS